MSKHCVHGDEWCSCPPPPDMKHAVEYAKAATKRAMESLKSPAARAHEAIDLMAHDACTCDLMNGYTCMVHGDARKAHAALDEALRKRDKVIQYAIMRLESIGYEGWAADIRGMLEEEDANQG